MPNIKSDKYCALCPHHKVIPDPDPSDWFNDDDCAIVCTLQKNNKKNPRSKYAADRQDYKVVSGALRPYETQKVEIPKWCPK